MTRAIVTLLVVGCGGNETGDPLSRFAVCRASCVAATRCDLRTGRPLSYQVPAHAADTCYRTFCMGEQFARITEQERKYDRGCAVSGDYFRQLIDCYQKECGEIRPCRDEASRRHGEERIWFCNTPP